MIYEFAQRARVIFFPKDWANSVVRWITGVHSPNGTIRVKNTANPTENGSLALDVNIDAIASDVLDRLDSKPMTDAERERVKMFVRGFLDGVSLNCKGEHIAVETKWLEDQITIIATNIATSIVNDALEDSEYQAQPEAPTNATAISSGVAQTQGGNSASMLTDTVTLDGSNGATLLVAERIYNDGDRARFFFRKLTISGDGRIVSIGREEAAKDVYDYQ